MPTVEDGFDITLSNRTDDVNNSGARAPITILIKNNTDEPVTLSASNSIQVSDDGANLVGVTAPTVDPSELTIAPGGELEKQILIQGNDGSQTTYNLGVTVNFDGGLPSVSGQVRGDLVQTFGAV